jgi:hypothetical protein
LIAADILAELRSLPHLPPVSRFTHGDACLPKICFTNSRGLMSTTQTVQGDTSG